MTSFLHGRISPHAWPLKQLAVSGRSIRQSSGNSRKLAESFAERLVPAGAVFRSAKGNCPHSGTQGFDDGKHIYSERLSALPEVPGSRRIEFPETAICLSGRTRYRGRKRVVAVSVWNSCERIRWNFEGATRLVSDDMLSGRRTPAVRHPGGQPAGRGRE